MLFSNYEIMGCVMRLPTNRFSELSCYETAGGRLAGVEPEGEGAAGGAGARGVRGVAQQAPPFPT